MLYRKQPKPCVKFCKLCVGVALPSLVRLFLKYSFFFLLLPSLFFYGIYSALPDISHSQSYFSTMEYYSQLSRLSSVILSGTRAPTSSPSEEGESASDDEATGFMMRHFGVRLGGVTPSDIFANKLWLEVARDQRQKGERLDHILGRVREKRPKGRAIFTGKGFLCWFVIWFVFVRFPF
jgi:hypothetical protein